MASLSQSSASKLPERSFSLSTLASAESSLVTNCSLDISRLKTKVAPGASERVATYLAMFSAKAVLPIAGRAATMIRSEGCNPLVLWSRSAKPVGRPVTSLSWAEFRSRVSKVLGRMSRMWA